MTSALHAGSLVLVTSRRRLSPDARTTRDELLALDAFLDDAIAAGVDAIQIREADLESGLLCSSAEGVVRRAAGSSVRVLVNDRVDVAVAAGVHGVHLPAAGLPAQRVRALMPRAMLGRSIHPGESADEGGLDYLMFGTVFASDSKPGLSPSGTDALAAVAARSALPVLAIGGITPARAVACLEAGASGIAAIGAFLPPGRSSDAMGVGPAVRAFREALARIC